METYFGCCNCSILLITGVKLSLFFIYLFFVRLFFETRFLRVTALAVLELDL